MILTIIILAVLICALCEFSLFIVGGIIISIIAFYASCLTGVILFIGLFIIFICPFIMPIVVPLMIIGIVLSIVFG